MDFFLYGIFVYDLVDKTYVSNQDFLELARTPAAINLGILGAFLIQSRVRGG